MERKVLNAEKRETAGKGVARTLRRQGVVPAVVYREGKSQPITIKHKEFTQFLKDTHGEQVIVSLKFPDGQDKLALMKEYQLDPVRGEILHTDFFEVSLTEKIKAMVHVVTTGEPIGVKRDGGILQHGIREIEVECLPDQIPGHVSIDITRLAAGNSAHVSELVLGEGIKILNDPHEVIASVVMPVVEKVPTPEEAAAVAAVPATAAEPEVIKKGKKEEEEKA